MESCADGLTEGQFHCSGTNLQLSLTCKSLTEELKVTNVHILRDSDFFLSSINLCTWELGKDPSCVLCGRPANYFFLPSGP